jgi:biopolymer transport protein ExbD
MAGNFGGQDDDVISGINVTPLVDVVLVLLVIFLMTAPVLYQSAIKVQLPEAKSGEQTESNLINFTLDAEGNCYFKGEKILMSEVIKKLGALTEKQKSEPVMIGADRKTPHGSVVELMDLLKGEGLTKFGLNVDQKSK